MLPTALTLHANPRLPCRLIGDLFAHIVHLLVNLLLHILFGIALLAWYWHHHKLILNWYHHQPESHQSGRDPQTGPQGHLGRIKMERNIKENIFTAAAEDICAKMFANVLQSGHLLCNVE